MILTKEMVKPGLVFRESAGNWLAPNQGSLYEVLSVDSNGKIFIVKYGHKAPIALFFNYDHMINGKREFIGYKKNGFLKALTKWKEGLE